MALKELSLKDCSQSQNLSRFDRELLRNMHYSYNLPLLAIKKLMSQTLREKRGMIFYHLIRYSLFDKMKVDY